MKRLRLQEKLCPWLAAPLKELEDAASRERLSHAWIFAGQPGLGKLNLALVLADRLLNDTARAAAPEPFAPEEVVAANRERYEPAYRHPDLHLLYPEEGKQTIGVDQVRAIANALGLKAHGGRAKVVVIEPAEAMTIAAANALLKTLEEPTPDTYLFLVCHRPGRLPVTIRSRCQTVAIRPPANAELLDWLGPTHGPPQPGSRSTPILAAMQSGDDYINLINVLEANIDDIYENRSDPQTIGEQWAKQDLAAILNWLVERTQRAIRGRIVGQGTNPVTDLTGGLSENHWNLLSTETLFEQLRRSETLRDQLGTGVNAELALRVLLFGFIPVRGRT